MSSRGGTHRSLARAGALALAGTSAIAQADGVPGEQPASALPPRAVITVSKAADALGAPIDLSPRVTAAVAQKGIAMPSGLPVARAALTSRFGMRVHPIQGGYRMHSGVDLAAPAGSPVVAPADGVVSFANWRGGYGLMIALEHAGGLQTRLGHLSQLLVSPGQQVTRGQLIGLVGATGRATGSHLHYEMRQDGRAVDPLGKR